MARSLMLCALVLTFPTASRGQAPQAAQTLVRRVARPMAAPAVDPVTIKIVGTLVSLEVTPMAAPKPALRHQLLPELRETSPGNPVQGYLKCFMEQQHFFFRKEAVDEREKWQTMPLKELPVEALRGYGGKALQRADDAARLDNADWQILAELRRDGINTLLPEVQQLRLLANALRVRFRGEVADRRFDDAVRTAKTMFALSRHLGEHPTLIALLVGASVAVQALTTLDEMIGQPDCPNLYWALAHLPAPFLDLRKGIQGERLLWRVEMAFLDDRAAMTEGQVGRAVERLRKALALPGGPKQDVGDWLKARTDKEAHVRGARKRLIEHGLDVELVKSFPPTQVVLLDEKREFEERRDDHLKWLTQPAWKVEAALERQPGDRTDEDLLFGSLLLNATHIRRLQGRLEQRVALLQAVEALRMYAADNGGKLPGKLDELKVPVPDDPFTGKPFAYRLEGGKTAILQGSPPRAEEKNPAYNVSYEVTLRK